MSKGQRWFIIIAGTIAVFGIIGALTGSQPRSNAAVVAQPSPAAATSQGGTGAQQPSVPPVDQSAPKTQTVLGYVDNDYIVGNGQGMIPTGRYQSGGDDKGFTMSTWTSYSDLDKQHVLDFGSIGKDQNRFMSVAKNAKVVSLTGDAVWIKVG